MSNSSERLAEPLRCRACSAVVSARDVSLSVSRAGLDKMPVKQTDFRRSIVTSDTEAKGPPLLGVSLDLIGDKWSIEIINCAFLGIKRFGDFKIQTGIAGNILADRLNRLITLEFLSRGHRRGVPGYWLTQRGLSFYPVLLRLQDWADAWIVDRYRSPVTLVHKLCGQPLAVK